MKTITERINNFLESSDDETETWEIFTEPGQMDYPGSAVKSSTVKVRYDAEYIEIDLESNYISFYNYDDIQVIDKENGLKGKFEETVGDLRKGETYYDKSNKLLYIRI